MDPLQTKQTLEFAAATAAHSAGMKILSGKESEVVAKFIQLGVEPSTSEYGTLELRQGETEMVLSKAFEKVRTAAPELFVADPRRDAVTSRQDLERGSPDDILRAKSAWISQHGLSEYERLPQTRAKAEAVALIPSTEMSREEYLRLPVRDKARLAGLKDGDQIIARIMSRTK